MNLVKKLLIIILVQLICVFLFIRHNQLPLTHDEDSQTFSGHFDKAKAKKAVLQEVMCAEDKIKVARMASLFEKDNPSAQDFFGVVYFPLQSICESVKIIAGAWNAHPQDSDGIGAYDGHKMICLDDILEAQEECLVYSFGIGYDASFEQTLARMGCIVHGYDHTIPETTRKELARPDLNFNIYSKGVGAVISDNLTTFEYELESFGHLDSVITILKVDIEYNEYHLVPSWVEGLLLSNVKQIVIEYHNITDHKLARIFTRIWKMLTDLGFSFVGFDPNWMAGIKDTKSAWGEMLFVKRALKC